MVAIKIQFKISESYQSTVHSELKLLIIPKIGQKLTELWSKN